MTRRIAAALATLAVALAGCAADPIPEGSGDSPTDNPTAAGTTPAVAEPDRAACKEAIKDEAFAGTLNAGDIPAPCEGIRPDELVAISREAIDELEAVAEGLETEPETTAPSTCDVAREAFLTGTEEEIEAALGALIEDRDADATAREAAQSYLETDDPTLRGIQQNFVQYACSIP
jgi:hypothetical protein